MVLGFKKQFIDKIKSGSKIHTIREDISDRWKPGKNIHFATGVMTKNYKQFGTGICQSIQYIKISRTLQSNGMSTFNISINGRSLNSFESYMLAKNDGFKFLNDLLEWFTPIPTLDKNRDIEVSWIGKIIHWTDFKY